MSDGAATSTRDLGRRLPCAASIRRLLAEVVREAEAAEARLLWTLTPDRRGSSARSSIVGVVASTGLTLSAGAEDATTGPSTRPRPRDADQDGRAGGDRGRIVSVMSAINPVATDRRRWGFSAKLWSSSTGSPGASGWF